MFENDKIGLMNHLLEKVVNILNENNIPYYLDCGTLLGCVRENSLMKKDTDVDVSIHLSMWDKLNAINFNNYELIRTRTWASPHRGYLITIKTKFSNFYCDIYANPSFPILVEKEMGGKNYFIPKNSELYLTQLYGNWKVPSKKHAIWPHLFYSKLITGEYYNYWDLAYDIQIDTSNHLWHLRALEIIAHADRLMPNANVYMLDTARFIISAVRQKNNQ